MKTPTARGPHQVVPGSTVVTMASRLELRRFRDVPAFFVAALRLRRRFQSADGGVRLDLDAHPLGRSFFTLSSWRDEEAMAAYTADPLHREVMRRFRPKMAGSAFVTWSESADDLTGWAVAAEKLTAAT